MADEGTAKRKHCERPAAHVRIEFIPAENMPDGCRVMPIEAEGSLVWGVREGEMTNGCREEFNEYLEHIVGNRLWEQNWGGETPPPHPH